MKRKYLSLKCLVIAVASLTSLPGLCLDGDKGGNGGDICEDRFKVVRDDIASWIRAGGSSGLDLSKVRGLSTAQYDEQMLAQIGKAKVSCVDEMVEVGSAEKTCRNFLDTDGSPKIVCNRARFMQTADSDQYVLVHHEYAGLAGIEINDGESSLYFLSNQITDYLEEQVVKKLVVKPKKALPADPKIYGEWVGETTQVPDSNSSDIWTFSSRISIQPGKMVVSVTCRNGGHSTSTVAVPIQATGAEVIPQYAAEQVTSFRRSWFGEQLTCTANQPGDPFPYRFEGKYLILGAQKYTRARKASGLGRYPLSQPQPTPMPLVFM